MINKKSISLKEQKKKKEGPSDVKAQTHTQIHTYTLLQYVFKLQRYKLQERMIFTAPPVCPCKPIPIIVITSSAYNEAS